MKFRIQLFFLYFLLSQSVLASTSKTTCEIIVINKTINNLAPKVVSYDYLENKFKFHEFIIKKINNETYKMNISLDRSYEVTIFNKHLYIEPGQKYKLVVFENKIVNIISTNNGNLKIWDIVDSLLITNSSQNIIYDRPINVFNKYQDFYNLKLSYLDNYFKNHEVTNKCYDYAKTEFKSTFLLELIGLKKFFKDSTSIIDSLINSQFDFNYFNRKQNLESKFFAFSLYSYVSDILCKNSNQKYSVNHLSECFNLSNSKFTGELCDFLNTYTFRMYCKNQNKEYEKNIDSLYEKFKYIVNDTKYLDVVETWYLFYKKANKRLPLNISNIQLVSTEGKITTLQDLINLNINKRVIFDFWASWCSPCIKQIKKYSEVESNINLSNYEIYFISLDSQISNKITFANNVKSFIILNDKSRENLMEFFSVPPIPKTILLENGILKDLNYDFTSFLMKF